MAGIEEASSAMIGGHIAGIAAAYRGGYVEEKEFLDTVKKYKESLAQLRQGMFAVENRGKDIRETEEGCLVSQNLLKSGHLEDACKFGCIAIGEKITSLPVVVKEADCKNCGMCVASCSGQAIFLIDEDYDENFATVTMPYELLPYPEEGTVGKGLGRSGEEICQAIVVSVKTSPVFDKTALLTIKIPKEKVNSVRFFAK